MATQPTHYYPGGLTSGLNYGVDRIVYPFLNYPVQDTNTKLYEVTRWGLVANYVPQNALAPYASNPNAYLVDESELSIDQLQQARYVLKYSTIPPQETSFPGSRYIPLPAVTNDFGSLSSMPVTTYPVILSVGVGYFNSAATAIYTEYQQSLYGATKATGARVIGYATGGTFTLTYGASTTSALNYNDSAATIQTAINGLASVISAGLTATVSNDLANATLGGTISITWAGASTFTPLTLNGGSLTVTTSNHPTTQVTTSANQTIRLADQYTITSHGFSTSVALAAVATDSTIHVIATANWGSVDSNTIWLPNYGTAVTWAYVGPFSRTYVPGQTYLLRVQQLENFYLPGISANISSPANIPVPADLQNPPNFVSALLTKTGFQTYQSEGPAPWPMGPRMYRLAQIQINMGDF